MSDVRLMWRPIDRWPRAQTVNRESSPFRTREKHPQYGYSMVGKEIGWTDTRVDVEGMRSLSDWARLAVDP